MRNSTIISVLAYSMSAALPLTIAIPSVASARDTSSLNLPAMPLEQALQAIQAHTGEKISYDPDAVRGQMSSPVQNARTAQQAVAQAIRETSITQGKNRSGELIVGNDILVIARPDESELNTLVRGKTSSSRTGQTLREQPRNTSVVSSKTIEDQQAQSIFEALRNVAGVTMRPGSSQGGGSYSIRGFSAGGIVNGLPASSNGGGVAVGVSQPIDNIERIEVLKGPDALLSGSESLGGTINVVTKKPNAESSLSTRLGTGSWGQVRVVVDGTQALNESKTLSARFIASAADAKRNYGGYTGNGDYLVSPSIRFKNSNTDITMTLNASRQTIGFSPFIPLNQVTRQPYDIPHDKPIFTKDQSIRIGSTQFYVEATQNIGDWLTLVGRAQHEDQSLFIKSAGIQASIDGSGTVIAMPAPTSQKGNADTVDGYARIKVTTGPIKNTLTVGGTYVDNKMNSFVTSQNTFAMLNIFTDTVNIVTEADQNDYTRKGSQFGLYAQYLVEFWKFHLLAGVRRNETRSEINYHTWNPRTVIQKDTGYSPSYGIVFDVAKNFSLYGNLVYGYLPNYELDANNQKLPNNKTRNLEGGFKLDLFHNRALINASYFSLKQSNRAVADPLNPGKQMVEPGQLGKGVDFSITGQISRDLSVIASYTHTKFKLLSPSIYGQYVTAQPKDQYSINGVYSHTFEGGYRAGLSLALRGNSKAPNTQNGSFWTPASRQFDGNITFAVGKFDMNLGVRNIFDRTNYSPTPSSTLLPLMEPRNWRLTAGYKF